LGQHAREKYKGKQVRLWANSKKADSEVRPMKGYALNFEYYIASRGLMRNDYSWRETKGVFSYYHPVTGNFSHCSSLEYYNVSYSAPFFEYPYIRVRGIERSRHKDAISYVVQNEERYYYNENVILVPFIDIGRVKHSFPGNDFTRIYMWDMALG